LVVLTTGVLLGAQLIVTGGASAATPTLTITADRFAAIPAGHNWGYNDFFPRILSIHRGATIAFSIQASIPRPCSVPDSRPMRSGRPAGS